MLEYTEIYGYSWYYAFPWLSRIRSEVYCLSRGLCVSFLSIWAHQLSPLFLFLFNQRTLSQSFL